MGDDWTPVRAARISYGDSVVSTSGEVLIEETGLKGPEADTKLLRYLLKNGHTSPFEMVELTWEIVAPIFVARQWVRHRTANWNEVSARYTEVEAAFWLPEELRIQNKKGNKQGSSGRMDLGTRNNLHEQMKEHSQDAFHLYHSLIRQGVAQEQARSVLPLGTYTHWIWKNDLHNTLHFLKLRMDEHAQPEIRVFAEAMANMMREQLPVIMGVWESLQDGET